MPEITVMQAKRYGVYTCELESTLRAVAQRMADDDISALVVVDRDGYLAGIITRTDIVRAYREGPAWASRCVAEYMNPDVITVGLQTTLNQVATILLDRHIHRVVVVRHEGEKQRPIAVFSIADLIYHMAKEAESRP